MFFASVLVFVSTDGVGTSFNVLRSRTHFRRNRGHHVKFSWFALPDQFSTVPRASGPVFFFCALGFILDDKGGVGSRFNVLRSWTHFRRYRGRQVPFSCFALSDSYSTVPRASGPVFIFCAPGLIFDARGGVSSNFHVLRSRTRFRLYRGRRFQFSCFVLPNSFSAVPRAPVPILMFCAPVLIFIGTEVLESRIYVFRSQTHFRR
jgi:hypothetical protein